ncbi:sensor domain-containing protein [Bacillus benzoevorans]|uniref:Diguanylate cyclase (GGDEF)-like protein/PAS domain S-box-containing protein n=1 Tax=Bacillus benzoevorans TaxID=1456 RepID=A0A7X0HSN8_9BACI|nr:bifunctional diguanylate cyclase/phosphodiesterase [Bacillus benzoevorans]MBB6446108.1 diguanylate cyclase (GGDEF)-like protein/PAS domain S-box-containing protein [Bacillus benzoevorans]
MEQDAFQLSEMMRNEFYYSLMDELQIGIYLFAPEGKTLLANSNFLNMLGYSWDELQSKTIGDLFAEEDVLFLKKGPENGEKEAVLTGKRKDQSALSLHLFSYEVRDDSSIFIALLDKPERSLSQSSQIAKLEKLAYALENTAAVTATDADGNIIYVNDRFCEVSKYSREELLGNNHRIVKSGRHPKEYFEELWQTITSGKIWRNETCNKAKDGSIWWGSATIVPLLNKDGIPYQYIGIRQDVTDRKILEEKYYEMAYYDFLTKLPNRRLFESQLEMEVAEAQKKMSTVSLMIIDLHGLKFVNDSLGTEMGDQLLQRAAIRLNQFVHPEGTLFRIDGNEFAVILPKIAEEDLVNGAKSIIHLFSQPFAIDGYELFLNVNIGMCIYPDGCKGFTCLIKNASFAMHQTKAAVKNGYLLHSNHMLNSLEKKWVLKNDLRRALKEEEFFLFFQPRIDPRLDKIIGAEALIRWNHPKFGVVSPLEFIPLAEEEGLIGQIGEWVLYQACRQNKKWQDAGLSPVIVSVNYSMIQFLHSEMIQEVARVLKQTGLEPQYLEIEITETALMKDEAMVSGKIDNLKLMGVKTAIDDFGTGYASLSYLKNLKTNTLKIDSSFIEGIPLESVSSEIVASIIQLAKKLNIRTVAEGVENIEQLRLLKEIHVDEIQGYLYSKPVPTQEFEQLLKMGKFLPR